MRAANERVLDHHAQRLEDGAADFGHELAHAHARFFHLAHGLGQRRLEAQPLLDDAAARRRLSTLARLAGGSMRWARPMPTPGDAPSPENITVPVSRRLLLGARAGGLEASRGAGDGLLHLAAVALAFLFLALQALGEMRVDHERADLAGHRARKADFFGREAAAAAALHDEHAARRDALADGHAEEGVVLLLAGLREELEARMRQRVVDDDGRLLLDDEADEALGLAHRHAADAAGRQAVRGRQAEQPGLVVVAVEGADLAIEGRRDHAHEAFEGFSGSATAAEQDRQFFEQPQVAARAARPVGCRSAFRRLWRGLFDGRSLYQRNRAAQYEGSMTRAREGGFGRLATAPRSRPRT